MKTESKKVVLPNGTTVLAEYLPAMQTAAIGCWFRAGSRHEPDGLQGACHYIEHMLFKGTARRTAREIAVDTESVGAHMNAMTGKENTCFYAKSLSEDLPRMAEILLDMCFNSTFAPEEFERERQVVLEEIHNLNDTPEDFIFEQFIEDTCGRVGLGHSVLGYDETVGNFTRDDLFRLYRAAYKPESLVISIAGNLNGADPEKLIAGAMGEIGTPPAEEIPPCRLVPCSMPGFDVGVRVYNRQIEQVNFVIGTLGIPYNHPDRYAYAQLDLLMSGGMSSRLFQEIREKRGLVYDISTSSESYIDSGFFTISAGTRPDNLREVLEITAEEFRKVRDGDVTAEELARIRRQLRAGMAMSFENPSGRMMRIARSEIYYGRQITDDEIMDAVMAVTLDDIARVTAYITRPGAFSASLIGPYKSKKKTDSAKKMVEDIFGNI